MIEALVVFSLIFLADVCWVLYSKNVQNDNPVAAGLWAVMLIVPGGLATISFVQNPWMIIPAGMGAFAGTALTMWWVKRKQDGTNGKDQT